MRILLIDDDKVYSEPLVWQLGQEGYDVTYCQSIEDVLDEKGKMRLPKPDCILLDIMMPSGDRYNKRETDAGKDTGSRLLEDLQREVLNTPVIIITIRTDLDEDEVRKRFKSVKKVLVKPVTPTEVAEVIKNVCPKKTEG